MAIKLNEVTCTRYQLGVITQDGTMEDGSGASRPKRRCSSRAKPSTAPSAVHYVGYVEEDETPEAIMKKFEELDKVNGAIYLC